MASPPTLDELLVGARSRVFHLELRDHYAGSQWYEAWVRGLPYEQAEDVCTKWHAKVKPVVSRGVTFRRARIVSVPVSTYVRFEHEATPLTNLAAGESVRWLSRHLASEIPLPGNDFWLVDDVVLFSHFSGDDVKVGTSLGSPGGLAFCVTAFEHVWERATDHSDYELT